MPVCKVNPDRPLVPDSGEWQFARHLEHAMPEGTMIWNNLRVRGKFPDFIVFHPELGFWVFEVKSWHVGQQPELTQWGARLTIKGEEVRDDNPFNQAQSYAHLIENKIFARQSGQDTLPFRCAYGAVFSNLTRANFSKLHGSVRYNKDLIDDKRVLCSDEWATNFLERIASWHQTKPPYTKRDEVERICSILDPVAVLPKWFTKIGSWVDVDSNALNYIEALKGGLERAKAEINALRGESEPLNKLAECSAQFEAFRKKSAARIKRRNRVLVVTSITAAVSIGTQIYQWRESGSASFDKSRDEITRQVSAKVSDPQLPLRSSPESTAPVVGTFRKGTEVCILHLRENGWLEIQKKLEGTPTRCDGVSRFVPATTAFAHLNF
jgi:hypothetical protein